jgi:hypothetical protein
LPSTEQTKRVVHIVCLTKSKALKAIEDLWNSISLLTNLPLFLLMLPLTIFNAGGPGNDKKGILSGETHVLDRVHAI